MTALSVPCFFSNLDNKQIFICEKNMAQRMQLSTTLDGSIDYNAILGEDKDDHGCEHDNGHEDNKTSTTVILEQERFMPIANISRIMKRILPERAKLSKEAKECIQECVTEFFLFITSEAAEKCNNEKRKTITGEDLLNSMETLGFDEYLPTLKTFLKKYRDANRAERAMSDENSMRLTSTGSVQIPVANASFTVAQSPQVQLYQAQIVHNQPPPQSVEQIAQTTSPLEQAPIQNLPANFRQATHIFIDSVTLQHYLYVNEDGSPGLFPIEIRTTAVGGQGPQPIPLQSFQNNE
uniref:Transcription factor CBF/NF-Y/archaeal histone domain-containing protein n=1 Tax=Panagrolaimus sp. JU765 TaxID=591449 RepID=A0AC34RLM4_9BILA